MRVLRGGRERGRGRGTLDQSKTLYLFPMVTPPRVVTSG